MSGGQAYRQSQNYTDIDVFDINKNKISRIQNLKELHTLHPGLYILKYYKEKECVKTTKYMRR